MSAIMNWIAWLRPIGPPNASRCAAYFTDSSTQPWASPTASAEIAIRPSPRMERNCAYPRPRSPTRFSAGTRQSLNESSRVSEAFQPTFEYRLPTLNPGVPDGMAIAEISLPPSGRVPVTAVTVTSSVRSVPRSEEHTSELQSRQYLVCRLLLEKKKKIHAIAA